jgi:hypothetical protein
MLSAKFISKNLICFNNEFCRKKTKIVASLYYNTMYIDFIEYIFYRKGSNYKKKKIYIIYGLSKKKNCYFFKLKFLIQKNKLILSLFYFNLSRL